MVRAIEARNFKSHRLSFDLTKSIVNSDNYIASSTRAVSAISEISRGGAQLNYGRIVPINKRQNGQRKKPSLGLDFVLTLDDSPDHNRAGGPYGKTRLASSTVHRSASRDLHEY
jgi:hypothetical protein